MKKVVEALVSETGKTTQDISSMSFSDSNALFCTAFSSLMAKLGRSEKHNSNVRYLTIYECLVIKARADKKNKGAAAAAVGVVGLDA
jgi:hypothetical protein